MDAKKKAKVNDRVFDVIADSGLTQLEQDFVLYYLQSNNIAQSYMKAYTIDKKYAYIKGYQLFHKPKIQSQIKKLKKLLRVAYDIDPCKYVETLNNIANADIGEYIKFSEEEVPVYDESGCPVINPDTGEPVIKKVNKMHLADSSRLDTSIITEIKQGRDGISIKLADKMKAWEKLRDFFDWKSKEQEKKTQDNNLMDALNEKSEIWDNDPDKDLKEMQEEENE